MSFAAPQVLVVRSQETKMGGGTSTCGAGTRSASGSEGWAWRARARSVATPSLTLSRPFWLKGGSRRARPQLDSRFPSARTKAFMGGRSAALLSCALFFVILLGPARSLRLQPLPYGDSPEPDGHRPRPLAVGAGLPGLPGPECAPGARWPISGRLGRASGEAGDLLGPTSPPQPSPV